MREPLRAPSSSSHPRSQMRCAFVLALLLVAAGTACMAQSALTGSMLELENADKLAFFRGLKSQLDSSSEKQISVDPAEPTTCTESLQGQYGVSASGYAPIIGVACGGACYESAKHWSALAVMWGDKPVVSQAECKQLCNETSGCEVWQWTSSSQKCELKEALSAIGDASLSAQQETDTSAVPVSGPKNCSTPWLQYPGTLPMVFPTDGDSSGELCTRKGHTFRSGCVHAAYSVASNTRTMEYGVRQGWWREQDVKLMSDGVVNMLKPDMCRQLCEGEGACTGFTFTTLDIKIEDSHMPLCVLAKKCEDGFEGRLWQVDGSGETYAGYGDHCASASDSALSLPELPTCTRELPRCRKPYAEGEFFGGGAFVPKRNCFYHWHTQEQALKCLQGKWLLISGGSNAVLFTLAILNYFHPGLLQITNDQLSTGHVLLFDVVLDSNGKVIYKNGENWREGREHGWHFGTSMSRKIQDRFRSAPAGHTRITLLVGQYFQNAEFMLREAVEGDGALAGNWASSKRVFYAQIMQWYLVCGKFNMAYCNREELRPRNVGAWPSVVQTYGQELIGFLNVAQDLCKNSNVAGCFFATNTFDSGQMAALAPMVDKVTSEIGKQDAVQLLDVFQLTSHLQSEIVHAHAMPAIHLTQFSLLLNSICDANPEQGVLDTGCHQDITFSRECTASQGIRFSECPIYKEQCGGLFFQECKDWECANTRSPGCTVSNNSTASASSAKDCQTWPIEHPPNPLLVKGAGRDSSADKLCSQSSCDDAWVGWALSCAALMLAVLAAVLLRDNRARTVWRSVTELFSAKAKQMKEKGSVEMQNGGSYDKPIEEQPVLKQEDYDVEKDTKELVHDSANGKVEKKGAPSPAKGNQDYMSALGLARFLASIHIVVGHLHAKGVIRHCYFCSFGYTWVPFFFVLSGFVLTHARLSSKDPSKTDNPFVFTWKRSSAIYPLYALALVATFVVRMARNSQNEPPFYSVVSQIFLTQAWFPYLTAETMALHCWFLSCIFVYWLIFRWLYAIVRHMTALQSARTLLVCSLLPWLSIILPTAMHKDLNWFKGYTSGSIDSPEEFWFLFIKFNPICYLHVFVFGMTLARLRQLVRGTALGTVLYEGAFSPTALLGYLGLIAVFSIRGLLVAKEARLLSLRLTIVLPLQGMVLLGLSGQSLLSRLFSLTIFQLLGDLSYAQYLFQFVGWEVWPATSATFPFFLFLGCMSWVMQLVVGKASRLIWLKSKLSTVIAPLSLLCVFTLIYTSKPLWETSGGGLPEKIALQNGIWDVRLNLWCDPKVCKDFALINPNLMLREMPGQPASVVMTARAHRIRRTREPGTWNEKDATWTTISWESQVVYTERPLSSLKHPRDWMNKIPMQRLDVVPSMAEQAHRVPDSRNITAWVDCERKPVYVPQNNTVMKIVVTGPEDPKLLFRPHHNPPQVDVVFNSYPSQIVMPDCQHTASAVHQMFTMEDLLGESGSVVPLNTSPGDCLHDICPGPVEPKVGVRINCGFTRKDEKNWIAFDYLGQMYFVYTVNPHRILSARTRDGTCQEIFKSTFQPLSHLQVARKDLNIRGSGTATLHKGSYYSLIHTKDKAGLYETFAYRFAGKPPFQVEAVSREPLPLQTRKAFASGLMLDPSRGKAYVSYGVDDAESRVLIMDLEYLESLLACTGSGEDVIHSGAGGREVADKDWKGPEVRGSKPFCDVTNTKEEKENGRCLQAGLINEGCLQCHSGDYAICAGCLPCADADMEFFDTSNPDCNPCAFSRECSMCTLQMECYEPAFVNQTLCEECRGNMLIGCAACQPCASYERGGQRISECDECREGPCYACAYEMECYGTKELMGRQLPDKCGTCLAGGELGGCAACTGCYQTSSKDNGYPSRGTFITDPVCNDCGQYCRECVVDMKCYDSSR